MEITKVHADLQALRKLYGLLQNSLDARVQESRNEILDERAKLLLKNLLDDATDKALEAYTKMIATSQSESYSKREQFNMVSKLVTSVSPDNKNIKSSEYSGIQNLGKYSNKLTSNRNKSCRGCQQRGMKKQQQQIRSTKATTSKLEYGTQRKHQYVKKLKSNPSNQSVRGKRINEIRGGNLVAAAAPSASSSKSVKPGLYGKKKSDNVTSDFSRDVDNAMRRIETVILDLQDDMDNALVNPKPIPLADGQISNRLLGIKQSQEQAQAQAQAQAIGLMLLPLTQQKEAITMNKKQPAPVVAHAAVAATCLGHKKKPPPRHEAILRPTLMETDCSESSRELAESDETSISISTSSSWKTNSSDSYSDSEVKSKYPKKFGYWGDKSSESSSDSSSRVTRNSSTRSEVQTNNKYRLYDHKAATNNPEEHTAIGRLRRFKNKLGFIFHHHHHHHHHHHYSKVRRHTNNKSMTNHYLQDIIQHKHRNENICVKQAAIVDKHSRKYSKKHANYFRKLVKGLMKHARQHSTKQNNYYGRRNLHWWQKFKRNGGVKLGNRRVRFGVKPTNLQRIRTIKMK